MGERMDAITEFREAVAYGRALAILAQIAETSYLGRIIHYGDSPNFQVDSIYAGQLQLRNAFAGGLFPPYHYGIG